MKHFSTRENSNLLQRLYNDNGAKALSLTAQIIEKRSKTETTGSPGSELIIRICKGIGDNIHSKRYLHAKVFNEKSRTLLSW